MDDSMGLFGIIWMLLMIALCVVVIVGLWKLYEKAGYAGWKCLIPFYNNYCLAEMAMGNGLLFLLLLVPCVNIVFSYVLYFKLGKAFGQSTGMAILTMLFTPIMVLVIAFSGAEYVGPNK